MQPVHTRILMIEDSPMQVRVIRDMLAEARDMPFELEAAGSLGEGMTILGNRRFDAILLDLTLPDSMGLDTYLSLSQAHPCMPVVVLSGSEDVELSLKAVQRGAQDYLLKGQVNHILLARALRYAIERQNLQTLLRNLALLDELTGLHNRRAFFNQAHQRLQHSRETGQGCLLLLADILGLKTVNDTYGHQEGDMAIMAAATVLKQAFRPEDTIARIGGDEFGVMVSNARPDDAQTRAMRIQEIMKTKNAKRNRRPYDLAVLVGTAFFDPTEPDSIDEMLMRADRELLRQRTTRQEAT